MRNIYYDTEQYPRYIGYDRGPAYYPQAGQTPYVPIGSIPQVAHTYKYIDGTYGVMNEHQVGLAESTCSAIFSTLAITHGGKALFSIDTLSRIAMERANTSRAAVEIMGALAEEHGFYGVENGMEGGAESLLVTDPQEAFVFHILPDDTGTSAIWVAARVPDDSIAVVANMFSVRQVNLSDSVNFLGSANMYAIAEKHGLWNASMGLLDFTATFSDGEYDHQYYSGRRMWGVYRLLAASQRLPSNYTNLKYDAVYPTFVKPDRPVAVTDIMNVHRDYYQGTPYDMTQGLAGGPWGDPDRWGTWGTSLPGAWERSIGLYRTAFVTIVQARAWLPDAQGGIVWVAPAQAAASTFVPVSVGVTALHPSLTLGNPSNVTRDSLYWAVRSIFKALKLKYGPFNATLVGVRAPLEAAGVQLVKTLDGNPGANLTQAYWDNVQSVFQSLWTVPDQLLDVWYDTPPEYPEWWLEAVGFQNGPLCR